MSTDEIRRQQEGAQISADALVWAYDVPGEAAEQERARIRSELLTDTFDLNAFEQRVNRHKTEAELRPALRESGLSDDQIDRLLADVSGRD